MISGAYSGTIFDLPTYSLDDGTLSLVCSRNWSLPVGSQVEATLTFDGVPLESVSQTKNSSDIDDVDDNVIEFEFTADDVRGLYGMIGRRVSIHIHETTHMLDPTSQRNRLHIRGLH